MKLLRRVLIAAMLLPALAAALTPREVDDFEGQAAGYARAAHLPPLSAGQGGDEVRVWKWQRRSTWVQGWVITPAGIRMYAGRKTIWPIGNARSAQLPQMLDTLNAVTPDQPICPYFRGTMLLIDGVHDGKRVVTFVGSPRSCKNPLSQAVANVYDVLAALAYAR